MACRSASVRRAQKKSNRALEAIKKLEIDIKKLSESEKRDFEEKIKKAQTDLGIDDFKPIGNDSAVKVDFTNEFNAEALIPVVTNVIKTAANLIAGTSAAKILLNPENIQTYSDLLGSIAEAIKTKSKTGGNYSFSRNRLAPGFFSFTSSKSMTITDKETFGEESITATFFTYALFFSQKHAAQMEKWSSVLTSLTIIRKLNDARIGLVESLIENLISIAEFNKLSDLYKSMIEKHESELASAMNRESVSDVFKVASNNKRIKNEIKAIEIETFEPLYTNDESSGILNKAIEIFSSRSSLYKNALREAKDLLNSYQ